MDRTEKASEVIQQTELLGVKLKFDSGLMVVVNGRARLAQEQCERIVEELGGNPGTRTQPNVAGYLLPHVRTILLRRAIAARAQQCVGRRVWSPVFGWGTVLDADGILGTLTVEIEISAGRKTQVSATAEDVVVIVDAEEEQSVTSIAGNEPRPDKPRRKILEMLRRTPSGTKVISPGREG
jgi:hypothetical protein